MNAPSLIVHPLVQIPLVEEEDCISLLSLRRPFVSVHSLIVHPDFGEVLSIGMILHLLTHSLPGFISVYSHPTLVVMNTILHTMYISTLHPLMF